METASDGSADRLNVTGTATVNGGNVEVTPQADEGYSDGQQFVILRTTTGIAGAFEGVDYAPGRTLAFFDPSLQTQDNDLLLQLDRNDTDFTDRHRPDLVIDPDCAAPPVPWTAWSQPVRARSPSSLHPDRDEAGEVTPLSGSGLTGSVPLAQLAGQTFLATIPTAAAHGAQSN